MHKTRPAFLCIFHKLKNCLLTKLKRLCYNKGTTKKPTQAAAKALKTEKRKVKMLNELINELLEQYPEQDKLINELLENVKYLRYDTFDSDDAITAIHTVRESLNALWDAVDMEDFNDRDISNKAFAEIIVNIKNTLAALEWVIDSDVQDTIYKFDLFIA